MMSRALTLRLGWLSWRLLPEMVIVVIELKMETYNFSFVPRILIYFVVVRNDPQLREAVNR